LELGRSAEYAFGSTQFSMARNPAYYAQLVDSPANFLTFLEVLREHRAAAIAEARNDPPGGFDIGPGGWENWTIEEFLEALEAYAQDADLPPAPTWRDFARLLLAGKVYE
jgi:hypothetical protein